MNEFLARWAASVLLAAALGGFGYWAGDHNRNNAWQALQTAQAQLAGEALLAEAQRSQAAATQSIKEQYALQDSYSTLEDKFNELNRRGPLVVFRSGGGLGPAGGCGGGAAVGAVPGQDAGVAGVGGYRVGGNAGIDLSLGAVWVWNSALAGTDAPAGACGAADTTAEACAAASGIPLEAAWANHVENAKSCAIDRLRHQHLIDFLTAAQGTAP